MKHIEIEITYDNFQELEGALNYIKTQLRKNVKNAKCEGETKNPFRVKFSNVNFFNVLQGENEFLKEPDRIETNEVGQTVLIYKSKMG